MACGRIAFFLAMAVLAHLSIARAEEGSGDTEERASFQFPGGNFGFSMGSGSLPNFSQLFGGSNGSNPFEAFLSAFRPGSNSSLFSGHRLDEVAAPDMAGDERENPENRLFFGFINNLFSTPTSCNYTTQPGLSCVSCTQRLNCFSSNVGRLTRCHFKTPYCNNGFCSKFPGAACFSTSTTSSAATTAAATTAAGTTTT